MTAPVTALARFTGAALPLALLAACGSNESAPSAPEATPETTPAASAPAATQAAAASGAAAPAAFAVCRSCHAVEAGRNGVGPTLFGIAGSKAGEVPSYAFSPALKASGITWTRENLDTWLQGPMKMVPGTKMVIGVPDPEKRAAILDYLETLK